MLLPLISDPCDVVYGRRKLFIVVSMTSGFTKGLMKYRPGGLEAFVDAAPRSDGSCQGRRLRLILVSRSAHSAEAHWVVTSDYFPDTPHETGIFLGGLMGH